MFENTVAFAGGTGIPAAGVVGGVEGGVDEGGVGDVGEEGDDGVEPVELPVLERVEDGLLLWDELPAVPGLPPQAMLAAVIAISTAVLRIILFTGYPRASEPKWLAPASGGVQARGDHRSARGKHESAGGLMRVKLTSLVRDLSLPSGS